MLATFIKLAMGEKLGMTWFNYSIVCASVAADRDNDSLKVPNLSL